MKKRELLFYMTFLLIIACSQKESKSSKNVSKRNINDYIIRKDSTIIHKKDLQISKTLDQYCQQIFKSERFCFENVRYELNPRIKSLGLRRIPSKRIDEFLNEAQKLDALHTLSLSRISLNIFPDLSSFNNLTSLSLNQLELKDTLVLPNYVKNHEYLSITRTKLKHIIFPENCKIRTLELYKNEINHLNTSFYHLKNLQYLFLRENPLFDLIDLNQFPHLKEVNLCGMATRDHIRKGLQKKYPHIKFNFCPEQIKVVFPDSVEAK